MRWTYFVAATVVFVLFLPAAAMAGPPAQVPVQGYLTDSQGVPLDGETVITVKVFDSESGGSALHTEQLTVTPTAGSFTAHLGTNQELDLAIFRDNDNLWLEVAVEGEVLEPRLRVATAPYAASAGFAEDAAKVGGKTVSELEQPNWDDIQNKPSDIGGSYSAGDGLTLNNGEFSVDPSQVQNRVSGTCMNGTFAVGVNQDGTLMCSKPSTAGAGDGLNKSGDTLSVDETAVQTRVTGNCQNGKKVVAINRDGTVQCGADATGGDIDAVNAGNGLSGGGSSGSVTLNVDQNGIVASMLKPGAVDSSAVQDGSISDVDISGSASITPGKIQGTAATESGGASFSGTVSADDFSYSSSVTRTVHVPASKFQVNDTTDADGWEVSYLDGNGELTSTSGNGQVHLLGKVDDLPEGAVLQNFKCYYIDDDASNDLSLRGYLKRREMTAGANDSYTNLGSVSDTSSGSSSSLSEVSDTSLISATVDGDYAYWVRVAFDPDVASSSLQFTGCKVTYEVDGPAP